MSPTLEDPTADPEQARRAECIDGVVAYLLRHQPTSEQYAQLRRFFNPPVVVDDGYCPGCPYCSCCPRERCGPGTDCAKEGTCRCVELSY